MTTIVTIITKYGFIKYHDNTSKINMDNRKPHDLRGENDQNSKDSDNDKRKNDSN